MSEHENTQQKAKPLRWQNKPQTVVIAIHQKGDDGSWIGPSAPETKP
jgi:hypothetical protein